MYCFFFFCACPRRKSFLGISCCCFVLQGEKRMGALHLALVATTCAGSLTCSPIMPFECMLVATRERPLKASVDACLVACSFRKPASLGSRLHCTSMPQSQAYCARVYLWCSALAAALDTSSPCVSQYQNVFQAAAGVWLSQDARVRLFQPLAQLYI